jgi:hypothetical protein
MGDRVKVYESSNRSWVLRLMRAALDFSEMVWFLAPKHILLTVMAVGIIEAAGISSISWNLYSYWDRDTGMKCYPR